jgi:hypothetical protein
MIQGIVECDIDILHDDLLRIAAALETQNRILTSLLVAHADGVQIAAAVNVYKAICDWKQESK